MENQKLLETVADIAYIAGYNQHYSGDSRRDMSEYVFWAQEFEKQHKHTNWDKENYILIIEAFATQKLNKSS